MAPAREKEGMPWGWKMLRYCPIMPMQGRYRQEDRIAPVYTICLYHGQEKWDGPRGLKDMVDFAAGHSEAEKKDWERAFIDYPMRLICANEPMDCSGFRTSLGAVFALLPLRGNKAGLERMLDENLTYEKLDEETAETISVLMGVKDFMEHKKELSNPTVTTALQTKQSSANYRNTIPWKKQKHGKRCKPRHHPKYSRTAKAFPVFAK